SERKEGFYGDTELEWERGLRRARTAGGGCPGCDVAAGERSGLVGTGGDVDLDLPRNAGPRIGRSRLLLRPIGDAGYGPAAQLPAGGCDGDDCRSPGG